MTASIVEHDRVASVDVIRSSFPALERRYAGERVAYFDGPGGTQVPRPVVEAMTDYLYHHNANTHWAYPSSAETDQAILDARAALADFLGASSDEIAFGQNMTTLAFHFARAVGHALARGDEIVVTELDHQANVAPWEAIAKERGVTLRTVRLCAESGQLDWDDFERCVTRATKVVAIGAASNALGTVNDVARAVARAHAVGALAFVDAVHFAPHDVVDVRAMGCDALACSAYKFYGPHVGVLYVRREVQAALDVPKLVPAPNEPPERLETGTQNHEGIVGAGAAVNFLASLAAGDTRRARLEAALAGLHARGAQLLEQMWRGLERMPGVTLYGPPPGTPRTPTLSFTVRGTTSTEVTAHLARRGVFASNGDFYATGVVERLGQSRDGLVRAGCACYTTTEEVDRLLAGVREVARG